MLKEHNGNKTYKMQDIQIQNNLKPGSIPLGKNLNIFKKVEFHYSEGNLWTNLFDTACNTKHSYMKHIYN